LRTIWLRSGTLRAAATVIAKSRRLWTRRYSNILINVALLGLVGMSFGTGWVASLFDLTEFGLHKYSSIALVLVACAHVVLHWRSLRIQLRNIGASGYDRRDPNQPDRRVSGR
jgi:hypothetical protein